MNRIKNNTRALMCLAIVLALVLTGCEKPQSPPTTSGRPMKLARYYWPGQFWKEIAKEKGWFADAGLKVELVDTNPDYFKFLQDTVEGKLDDNGFTFFDFILFRDRGHDLVAVIFGDDSHGIDALVARAEITSIHKLKGKRVGVSRQTYLEYILSASLARGGLRLDDVLPVDMPGEKCADAFVKNEVDAVMTWEPVATEALQKGQGRRLFDTSEIRGLSPSVMAFHRRFIEERPQDVQAYVSVWLRTTRFIREKPLAAFGIIARIYGKSLADVQAMADKDRIAGLDENRIAFTFGAGMESLHGSWMRMNQFMLDAGMSKDLLDSTRGLDDRFIRRLTMDDRGRPK